MTDVELLLVILAISIGAMPLAIQWLRWQRIDIWNPHTLFCIGFLVIVPLRATFDLANSTSLSSHLGHDIRRDYSTALGIACLGGIGVLFGQYLAHRPVQGSRPTRDGMRPLRRVEYQVLGIMSVLTLGATMLALARLAAQLGGARNLFVGRSQDTSELLLEASGYLYLSPQLLLGLGILRLVSAPRWHSKVVIPSVGMVLISQVLTLTSGSRSGFLPALGALVAAYAVSHRSKIRVIRTLAVLLLIAPLLINVPRLYRDVDSRESSLGAVAIAELLSPLESYRSLMKSADTAMVANLAVETKHVPEVVSYRHGATWVEALARPVPRSVWPTKPYSADQVLNRELFPSIVRYGAAGFSFSIFGEPYLNFGAPGVLVFGVIFGAMMAVGYRACIRHRTSPYWVAVYCLSWPFPLVYLRGGVGADYQRHVIVIIPVVIVATVSWFARRRWSGTSRTSCIRPAVLPECTTHA